MTKNAVDRISFLAEKFNVFEDDWYNSLSDEETDAFTTISGSKLYAIFTLKVNKDNVYKVRDDGSFIPENIRLSETCFTDVVQADPTEHKEYVQWMLNTFVRLIKNFDGSAEAYRFIAEDLYKANEYLEIFHENKHKPIFRQITENSTLLLNIADTSDINQYKSLSDLFNAVDPYIIRDFNELEVKVNKAVKSKDGEILFRDDIYTLFTPNTLKGSVIFKDMTRWCTTTSNSHFNNYCNQLTSYGVKSRLYIIINNKSFIKDNKYSELFQFHFESSQLLDANDGRINSIKESILDNSVGLSDYFYDLLIGLAKAKIRQNKDINNVYVKSLITMGFSNIKFEILEDDIKQITFIKDNIEKLPNLSRFKELEVLYLSSVGLTEIDESVCELERLNILSLPNNKIISLPENINKLKELLIINICGNKIKNIPDNIQELDTSKGGQLERISYTGKDISIEVIEKLKELLPNTEIVDNLKE